MSRRPDVYVTTHHHNDHPYYIIHRGYLASLLIRRSEAVDLANGLIDLVEGGDADGDATMR